MVAHCTAVSGDVVGADKEKRWGVKTMLERRGGPTGVVRSINEHACNGSKRVRALPPF